MTTYESSGVSLARGDAASEDAKRQIVQTFDDSVVFDHGIPGKRLRALYPELERDIIETTCVDGVGTKLIYAAAADLLETVGEDLVAMVVDDVVRFNRRPISFSGYRGRNTIEEEAFHRILSGMVSGCKKAGTPYLSGETAEMPGFYANNNFEIVGSSVAHHEFGKLRVGQDTQIGDALIALPSRGVASNGFSFLRDIWPPQDVLAGVCPVTIDEILEPTPIYTQQIIEVNKRCTTIRGWAHITGGGLGERGKIPQILPQGMTARLFQDNWQVPNIFRLAQGAAKASDEQMRSTFNLGLMFIAPVHQDEAMEAFKILTDLGCEPMIVGYVVAQEGSQRVIFS